jgi:hypothetical protein
MSASVRVTFNLQGTLQLLKFGLEKEKKKKAAGRSPIM